MIDGSVVRAHQHSSGSGQEKDAEAIGRSRGGYSTKIHVKVDAFGRPLCFELSGGQAHEMKFAEKLLGDEPCDFLLADKGYDSNDFRKKLNEQGICPVIPGKRNRILTIDYDKYIYKERNIVERFFCRIKQFRRIATRYDKTRMMFMGALLIVGIIIWLKL